jgi:hypothetical protein
MLAINHSLVVMVAALVMASGSDTTTDPSSGTSSGEAGRIMLQRAPGGEAGRLERSIWIVNADGSGLVQVTNGTDDHPDWGTPPATT